MNASNDDTRSELTSLERTAPDRVGPYRLLRQLGSGGMSIVYLAEKLDEDKKLFALKIFAFPFADDRDLERFIREQTILAKLDHPDIAKFYDSGRLPTGEGYFAMEYFPGVPINQFCKENNTSSEECIRLMIQVCDAVTYAHQQGVIHRDLKPTNILVAKNEDEISVKVIDFGIAKDLHSSDPNLALTRSLQILGTPLYMSPEHLQPETKTVDTRSDLFSLASVLVELLCGKAPCDTPRARELGIIEIQRMLLSDAPVTINKTSHLRQIDREVQWILSKALEKSKERRYPSVAEFAADLNRFLRRQPVDAGPPSGLYLISKFVARHRGTAILLALTAILLVAATLISLRQSQLASAAREIAERESYYSQMRTASDLSWGFDISGTKRILELNNPDLFPKPWKGIEWHFLNSMLQRQTIRERNCGSRLLQMQLSPDKKYLAILREPSIVEIWTPEDLSPIASLDTGSYNVAIAWDPSSLKFAIAGTQKKILLYDLKFDDSSSVPTLVRSHSFLAHEDDITALLFAQQGELLISGADDDIIKVWNSKTWELLYETPNKGRGIETLALSPDGKSIASGGKDGSIKIFALPNLELLQLATLDPSRVRCVRFDETGSWVAGGNIEGMLTIVETSGKQRLAEQQLLDGVEQLIVLEGTENVVTADRGGNLSIHQVDTSRNSVNVRSSYLDRWKVGESRVIALCQYTDELLLTGDQTGKVSMWSMNRPGYRDLILNPMAITKSTSSNLNKKENQLSIKTTPVQSDESHPKIEKFYDFTLASENELFLVPSDKLSIYLHDLSGQEMDKPILSRSEEINSIQYSEKSKRLYVAGTETVGVYSYPEMEEIAKWAIPGYSYILDWTSDEAKILVTSNSPKGCWTQCFVIGQQAPLFHIDYPDCRFAKFLNDQTIGFARDNALWIHSIDAIDPSTPNVKTSRHDSTLSEFCMLDDKHVITVGHDRLLKVSDINDGRLINAIEADQHSLTSAVLNKDRSRLITGSYRGSVKLWDTTVIPFRELIRLPFAHGPVEKIKFAVNERIIIALNRESEASYFDSRNSLNQALTTSQNSLTASSSN